MRPDDPYTSRPATPLIPQRPVVHSPPTHDREHNTHVAAANIARSQLNSIYSGNTHTPTPQTTPVAQPQQQPVEANNPYERTHSTTTTIQPDQWKQYHSAWQDYYQKYYERYYVGQVHKARQTLEARAAAAASAAIPEPESSRHTNEPETLTRDEALYDLRRGLLQKVRVGAQKVRQSRHFMPIAAAACVMLVFLFLQYNRVLFANVQAYISPGTVDPANIIVDPVTDVTVNADPKLIIPKINVDVPANYNTTPDSASQLKAMESGVAYFGIPGANSKPGQIGNTVLSGHSSNDVIDSGAYKFIFARLDQVAVGDSIYVNYESKRYTYTVTKKEVVQPSNVGALVYPTDKPVLTLITCTPLGTALNRLLVTAEQVSPDPKNALPASSTATSSRSANMPGNSPTFVDRILGNN